MTQPDLFHRPDPVPYRRTSRTSRQAAEALSRDPAKRQTKLDGLLEAYRKAGAKGLTDSEASAATGLPRSSICSLRALLMARPRDGVRHGYTTRQGEFGHAQNVYVAVTRS